MLAKCGIWRRHACEKHKSRPRQVQWMIVSRLEIHLALCYTCCVYMLSQSRSLTCHTLILQAAFVSGSQHHRLHNSLQSDSDVGTWPAIGSHSRIDYFSSLTIMVTLVSAGIIRLKVTLMKLELEAITRIRYVVNENRITVLLKKCHPLVQL